MSDLQPDFLDLTDQQIRTEVVSTALRESGQTAGSAVSFRMTIWETMALLIVRFYQTVLRPIAIYVDPRAATGFWLQMHGLQAAVQLRSARAARGFVTVTSAAGGRLRAGSTLEAGGLQFTTDTETRLLAGEPMATPITAVLTGDAGNVAAGSEVTLNDPDPADAVARLDAQWVTFYGHAADDLSTSAGVERFRTRVMLGYQIRGDAKIAARYRLAAFGVEGVSSCAVGRAPRGPKSVDVTVLFSGRLPTDEQLDRVRAAVDEAALATSDVRTVAPRVVSVAVSVSVTGTAILSEVEAAIDLWWRARVGIGDGLLVQELYAGAHAGVAGVTSIVYSSPGADLPPTPVAWYSPSISVARA